MRAIISSTDLDKMQRDMDRKGRRSDAVRNAEDNDSKGLFPRAGGETRTGILTNKPSGRFTRRHFLNPVGGLLLLGGIGGSDH